VRYVIYGAGAVGGMIGGRLFEAGHDVTLIARGAHLAAIQQQGLRMVRPDAEVTVRIPAVADPADADVRPGDVVMLAMKSQDTAAALERLVRVVPQDIALVCAQNAVENERMALRRFADVYAMFVNIQGDHLEPGVVRAFGTPRTGVLDLGRYPRGVDATARRIAADLDGAGFSSRAVEDPMRQKYGKLLQNIWNALDAMGGYRAISGELADRIHAEATAVLAAAGIDAQTAEERASRREGVMKVRPVEDDQTGSSSWQSLVRGAGSIETDYLNGEIALLGRLHGVPTPLNAALQVLIRRAIDERWPAASRSVDELARLIDGIVADSHGALPSASPASGRGRG
jgi:2-dehydropantoate 2-reductase